MNLPDIVRDVSIRTGIRQEDVSNILKATFTSIAKNVVDGETVTITSFGKFLINGPKERTFRDPRTGEKVTRMHSRMLFVPAQAIRTALKK